MFSCHVAQSKALKGKETNDNVAQIKALKRKETNDNVAQIKALKGKEQMIMWHKAKH
jgi:hypothetical protein